MKIIWNCNIRQGEPTLTPLWSTDAIKNAFVFIYELRTMKLEVSFRCMIISSCRVWVWILVCAECRYLISYSDLPVSVCCECTCVLYRVCDVMPKMHGRRYVSDINICVYIMNTLNSWWRETLRLKPDTTSLPIWFSDPNDICGVKLIAWCVRALCSQFIYA